MGHSVQRIRRNNRLSLKPPNLKTCISDLIPLALTLKGDRPQWLHIRPHAPQPRGCAAIVAAGDVAGDGVLAIA